MTAVLRHFLFAFAIVFAFTEMPPAATVEKPEPPSLVSPIALSKEDNQRLRAGKTLLKQDAGKAWVAMALVSQDAHAAAGLLMDFQKHTEIFPKLRDIAVTPLGESRYRLRSKVQAGPFSFAFTTLWQYDAATFTATFDLDKEQQNDFETYKGYWKFVPQEQEKALILYSIKTRTKNNPLAFLEDVESRKEMTRTLGELKTALELQEIEGHRP